MPRRSTRSTEPAGKPANGTPERLWEFRDHWIAWRRDGRSPFLHAFWYDQRKRQTRHRSLGTADLQSAQTRLAEFVLGKAAAQPKQHAPGDALLAEILLDYYEGHAKRLPSALQAQIACGLWNDFFDGEFLSDLTVARQESFHAWLRKQDHSEGYISRTLSVGRAAIKRAHKRGDVLAIPFIADVETQTDKRDKDPKGRPLSIEELARFIDVLKTPHLFLFTLISLNTLARPEAVFDLGPFQVDREHRLIDLNPAGRKQTKKYRPKVPMTRTLEPFLIPATIGDGAGKIVSRFVHYHGRPVANVKHAWRDARDAAGLDIKVTRYSLRHTMGRELRKRRISREDRELFMGHRVAGGSTAHDAYAPYHPDYLRDAADAIDAYMADLQGHLKRPFAYYLRWVEKTNVKKQIGA